MTFFKKVLSIVLMAMVCLACKADMITVTSSDNVRMDFQKLREDLDRLQAHVYTTQPLDINDTPSAPTQTPEAALENFDANRSNAQLGSKLQELRNDMATLRGQLEETNHLIELQETKITKLEQQLATTLKELTPSKAAPSNPSIPNNDANPSIVPSTPIITPMAVGSMATPPASLTPEDIVANEIKALDPQGAYEKSRTYISQGEYDKAETALKTFVEAFPEHELTGAGYYYLGELYYIQKKFKEAVGIFAEGYKAQPKGSKAPDSLLKMAQCFDALNQSKEACATLAQLHKSFPNLDTGPASTAKKLGNHLKCSLKDKPKK
jgi:tol-pal system protein YbgF